jgi:hypothetical protein
MKKMGEKIPAEEKDRILKTAYGRLETYDAEGVGIDKYSVDLKNWLESQPGVAKATLRGRSTITVEFEDNTQVGILLDRLNHYGSGYDLDDQWRDGSIIRTPNIVQVRDAWRWPWIPQTPGSTNALLFDPLYDDWPPESTTDGIETALTHAGYSVDKMLGDDADLAHLETIESNNYGVIFIRAHGGVLVVNGDDKIHIMVRPYFDSYPDPAASGYTGIGVFMVGTNWGVKYAYAFNEEFVRHHLAATNFPNTVVHLLVCHGGDPVGMDDLIDAFLDFGVGCYVGWTRNASLAHGDPAALAFFEYLCGAFGRTVAGAIAHIQSLGHSPDPSTGAELVAYGNSGLSLLGLRRIVVELRPEHIDILKKFPKETIELVVELPPGAKLPEWSPVGGKLMPVDRLGQRRFVPRSQPVDIFGAEEAMEQTLESFER